jgi:hypothetical protein
MKASSRTLLIGCIAHLVAAFVNVPAANAAPIPYSYGSPASRYQPAPYRPYSGATGNSVQFNNGGNTGSRYTQQGIQTCVRSLTDSVRCN